MRSKAQSSDGCATFLRDASFKRWNIETVRRADLTHSRIACGDFNVTPESDGGSPARGGSDYAHRHCAGIDLQLAPESKWID